jgi:hypothetical protein
LTQISKKFWAIWVWSYSKTAAVHGGPLQLLTASPKPATKVNSVLAGGTAIVLPWASLSVESFDCDRMNTFVPFTRPPAGLPPMAMALFTFQSKVDTDTAPAAPVPFGLNGMGTVAWDWDKPPIARAAAATRNADSNFIRFSLRELSQRTTGQAEGVHPTRTRGATQELGPSRCFNLFKHLRLRREFATQTL